MDDVWFKTRIYVILRRLKFPQALDLLNHRSNCYNYAMKIKCPGSIVNYTVCGLNYWKTGISPVDGSNDYSENKLYRIFTLLYGVTCRRRYHTYASTYVQCRGYSDATKHHQNRLVNFFLWQRTHVICCTCVTPENLVHAFTDRMLLNNFE